MEVADVIEFADFTSMIDTTLASTPGVTIAPSGTSHTKGSWVELVSSTAHDIHFLIAILFNTFASGSRTTFLADIGVGGAGSEQVLIPNLICGYGGTSVGLKHEYQFPIFIPAGSRIAIRCQSNQSVTSLQAMLEYYGNPKYPEQWRCGTKVTDYGTNTTTSGGVSINTGASGSYGTYTEITSGTSDDHFCLAIGSQINNSTSVSTQQYCYELAIGASSSEEVLARRWVGISSAGPLTTGPIPKNSVQKTLPSGTRISARGKCHTTSPNNNQFAVYGVS